MPTRRLSTRRKLLLLAGGVLLALLLLELGLRIVDRGPRWVNPRYVELSEPLPELELLLVERDDGSGPRYVEEFLYASPRIVGETVNFTDYWSARATPASVPLDEARIVVWTFGGSTMENTETTDELSIANTWATAFNEALGPTPVKNFGTGGFFSSYELIKFQKLLREVPDDEHPTIAIFYDGYNDALFGYQYGPGRMQQDLSLKLRALVEQDDLRLAAYAASRRLSRASKLWQKTAGRAAAALLFPLPEAGADEGALAATVDVYTDNVRMIGATCAEFGVRCLFLLQPLIVTKTPLHPLEQEVFAEISRHGRFGADGVAFTRGFYRGAARELAELPAFIDASSVLDGRDAPDFYDLGHTGALSSPVIGEATARLILARMEARPPVD